ncbi:PucR family transcriptional regulator [Micromonospora sp. SL1-18]|uniref:PucR family transcriptional regulator n=1 Tax=Micromonospora sp. SL1-18 TaxID=3399128 RepID=UPI003A4E2399
MAITVGELVGVPSLGTRVVAGASGLDRRISWAHVCELPEPWLWLGDGELLMTTGIGIPVDAIRQVKYVTELSAAGIVGIAIGDRMKSPDLHTDMVAAADRIGLPLLLTEAEVPFVALARVVANANDREEQARLATTERLYHHMRFLSQVDGTPQLLGGLGVELGATLALVSAGATICAADGDTGSPSVAAALAQLASTQPRPGGAVIRLHHGALAVRLPGPQAAALVAVPLPDHLLDIGLVQHAAAVVSAQRSAATAGRERARRLGASLLTRMIDGSIDSAMALDELTERRLDGRRVVAVIPVDNASDAVWADLHHRFDDAGIANALLTRGGLHVALLPEDEEALTMLLQALPPSASVGVSAPVDRVADSRPALLQATWALHQVRDTDRRVGRYAVDRQFSGFLPTSLADCEEAARRCLGPLLRYDETKGSQLVVSLRVFLEENRSWARAASRLYVHKQTLVYRMDRVEELTGRKLSSTADVAELWMALQAAMAAGLHGF